MPLGRSCCLRSLERLLFYTSACVQATIRRLRKAQEDRHQRHGKTFNWFSIEIQPYASPCQNHIYPAHPRRCTFRSKASQSSHPLTSIARESDAMTIIFDQSASSHHHYPPRYRCQSLVILHNCGRRLHPARREHRCRASSCQQPSLGLLRSL